MVMAFKSTSEKMSSLLLPHTVPKTSCVSPRERGTSALPTAKWSSGSFPPRDHSENFKRSDTLPKSPNKEINTVMVRFHTCNIFESRGMPASDVAILVLSSSFQHCGLQLRLWCFPTNQIPELTPSESGSPFLFSPGVVHTKSAMPTEAPTQDSKGRRSSAGSLLKKMLECWVRGYNSPKLSFFPWYSEGEKPNTCC